MMSGEYLLDTNVVIRLFANDVAIKRRLESNPSVLVPAIVIGELYFGAEKSRLVQDNVARIDRFIAAVAVLGIGVATGREYGAIKNELRLTGRPIPSNDLWIAALAREHGLTLVSSDQHFADIEGLSWEEW